MPKPADYLPNSDKKEDTPDRDSRHDVMVDQGLIEDYDTSAADRDSRPQVQEALAEKQKDYTRTYSNTKLQIPSSDILNKLVGLLELDVNNIKSNTISNTAKISSSGKTYTSPTKARISDKNNINVITGITSSVVDINNAVHGDTNNFPPSYYNYIKYPHRVRTLENIGENTSDDEIDSLFRIGDCCLVIPPQFIVVNSSSTAESIQGLRQSGSLYKNNGHIRKDIQVTIVFNGMDQINGYKVESPFEYDYYVDGLRTLIAQMKCTPFSVVENTLLNVMHSVHMVALRSISVQTEQGFPETISVTLNMQEFNINSYVNEMSFVMDSIIEWDLYRYYTQQLLRDDNEAWGLKKITTPNLTSDFSFKILKETLLKEQDKSSYEAEDDLSFDVFDSKNYDQFVSSKDNIELVDISFSTSNIMPRIQMSGYESPTFQYLGATDTTFEFHFETKSFDIATKFDEMNKKNQYLVRENREKNQIGFIYCENELVQLTGTTLIMINNITISTVPGFPGVYDVSITGVSYDSMQREKEKITVFRPFVDNRKGTKKDLISQTKIGITNKIMQDAIFERRIMDMNLYPDLHLPTLDEVDKAITKIRAFRNKYNLQQMCIDKIYRQICEMPGSINGNGLDSYNKYADPDFYIMYQSSLSDLKSSDSAITSDRDDKVDLSKIKFTADGDVADKNINWDMDLCSVTVPTCDVAVEPDTLIGSDNIPVWTPDETMGFDSSDLDYNDESTITDTILTTGDDWHNSRTIVPKTVAKRTGIPFLDLAMDRVEAGCRYIYGGAGEIYNANLRNAFMVHGSSHYTDTEQYYGTQVFDCSGFIWWCLKQTGIVTCGRFVASGIGHLGFTEVHTRANEPVRLGDLFYNNGHCGMILDEKNRIEAQNKKNGLRYTTTNLSSYTVVRIPNLIEKSKQFLLDNPSFYKELTKNPYATGGKENSTYTPNKGGGGSRLEQEVRSLTPDGKTQDARDEYYRSPYAPNTTAGSNRKVAKLGNFGGGNACDKWNDIIIKVCSESEFNFDPNMVKTFMMIESSGNPYIKNTVYPDIVGLMQVRLLYHKDKFNGTNYTDPENNIRAGCRVIKSYGSADWVKYNMKWTIGSYNYGPGNAKRVYNGTAVFPTETNNYMTKYIKYYNQLIENGGSAGELITLLSSELKANGNYGNSSGVNTDKWWETEPTEAITTGDSGIKNPTAGEKHGGETDSFRIDCIFKNSVKIDQLRQDVKSAGKTCSLKEAGSNPKVQARFTFKEEDQNISSKIKKDASEYQNTERMFHDAIQYSYKGRLSKAFPSYIFVIGDEQSEWIDGEKTWTNYYICQNVLDLNIHTAYDSPIATAKITLSNFDNNLSKYSSRLSLDATTGAITKAIYNLTGSIINQEISNEMIELKNELRDEIYLYDGARVHIRMGYGSNPAKYPTVFNGVITNIEHGEVITIIAQNDGVELTNHEVSSKEGDDNSDENLNKEASNIVANLFRKRESTFWAFATNHKFQYRNKYGIEHFGMYCYEGAFTLDDQFDSAQNIYVGNYKGRPYTHPKFLAFDGEANWRFTIGGRTAWDITKICEKALPDFVAYPRYFGLESRFFYGLPYWLENYKYDISDDGGLYVRQKSFMQMHIAHSLDSIIENNIKLDTRNLTTNYIGTFTVGGDLATTPIIRSDLNIDWSRQSTKTIDTTSVLDIPFIPGLLEKLLVWSGMSDSAKDLAINICVSELMDSWKNIYKGNILLFGQGEIRPHDWVYLDDKDLKLTGLLTVRETIHSMSMETGYTTTIVPGMIAFNNLKQSGIMNIYRSLAFIASVTTHYCFARYITVATLNRMNKLISSSKVAATISSWGGVSKNFITSHCTDLYTAHKNGKVLVKVSGWVDNVKDMYTTFKRFKIVKYGYGTISVLGKSAWEIAKAIFGISTGGVGAVVIILVQIAIDLVLGWLITAIVDLFAYNRCIVVYPLLIGMPDGSAKAYVGGVKGGKSIMALTEDLLGSYEEVSQTKADKAESLGMTEEKYDHVLNITPHI